MGRTNNKAKRLTSGSNISTVGKATHHENIQDCAQWLTTKSAQPTDFKVEMKEIMHDIANDKKNGIKKRSALCGNLKRSDVNCVI